MMSTINLLIFLLISLGFGFLGGVYYNRIHTLLKELHERLDTDKKKNTGVVRPGTVMPSGTSDSSAKNSAVVRPRPQPSELDLDGTNDALSSARSRAQR